ncbi:efflux RND transporter periplasmic adaptor subunit [Xanthomonas hyacinthi]|nr:efflux RND transporter periplasmic adaptor subunit [Xanthomonas hyacinthi]KLD78882.1 hypothetical protein Y886_07735 [Xanthomonas hyacinthi DSM 19077]
MAIPVTIKKYLKGVLVLLAVSIPVLIRANTSGGEAKDVEVSKASIQEVKPSVLASGTLAYATEVSLTAEVTAKVSEIFVSEGDEVKAGQLLIRLDAETYRNNVAKEDAAVALQKVDIDSKRQKIDLKVKQFERSKQLLPSRMIGQATYDEDRNALELALTDLRSSEQSLRAEQYVLAASRTTLSKTEILSPISGRVISLPIKVGEIAIPSTASLAGSQLLTVADTSILRAELKVDEGDIAKVMVGKPVDVFPAAYPDMAIEGHIRSIALAPIVEKQGRAYKVIAELPDAAGTRLQSGMSCRAEIHLTGSKEHLAIPVEALLSEGSEGTERKHFVVMNRNGVAYRQEVYPGISDDRWQEVVSGIKNDDVVVVGPSRVLWSLKDGDRLDVTTVNR